MARKKFQIFHRRPWSPEIARRAPAGKMAGIWRLACRASRGLAFHSSCARRKNGDGLLDAVEQMVGAKRIENAEATKGVLRPDGFEACNREADAGGLASHDDLLQRL